MEYGMNQEYNITLAEFQKMDKAEYDLWDVRDDMSFQYGHIGDARNLPLEQLKEKLKQGELPEQFVKNKAVEKMIEEFEK